jgi:hypothetical protein
MLNNRYIVVYYQYINVHNVPHLYMGRFPPRATCSKPSVGRSRSLERNELCRDIGEAPAGCHQR